MKAKNCSYCRKKIIEAARDEYAKYSYAVFKDSARSLAVFTSCCLIAVLERRGLSKAYIKKFFDDLCFVYDSPEVFGKRITMSEMMEEYQKNYEIDFDRVKLHLQTEKEFISSLIHDEKKMFNENK